MKRLLMKFIVGAAGIWCGERSRGAPRDLFVAVASLAMALAVAALAVAALAVAALAVAILGGGNS